MRPAGASIPWLVVLALISGAAYVSLHFAAAPADQVRRVLIAAAVGHAAWLGLLLWVARARGNRTAWLVIIGAALAFRAVLLPLEPATSQDVRRYQWEGLVVRAGGNPYRQAPDDPALRVLAAQYPLLHAQVTFPDIAAIYPPTLQTLFWLNAALFDGALLGWKLILLSFDALLAVACALFLQTARQKLLGVAAVLWSPLLLLDTYEAGHLDVIGAALLTLGLAALARGGWLRAGFALGVAINVKYLWPGLIALRAVAAQTGWWRRLGLLLATAALCVVLWYPLADGFAAARATAREFAERWTFNDPVFEALRDTFPQHRLLPMQLVVGALVGLTALLCWRRPTAAGDGWRPLTLWHDAWLLVGASLLLGPVAYPWYFIWLVPAVVWRPPVWVVLWVVLVPWLHLVDYEYVATGRWDAREWLWTRVDVVPAALLIGAWSRRLTQPARVVEWVSTEVQAPRHA